MKCESCAKNACYCSSHWLMNGGMIVYYWCNTHAVVGSEKFDPCENEKHLTCAGSDSADSVGDYWCCNAEFGKHEEGCKNYAEPHS